MLESHNVERLKIHSNKLINKDRFFQNFKNELWAKIDLLYHDSGIEMRKAPIVLFGDGKWKTRKGSKSGNYEEMKQIMARDFFVGILDEYNTSKICCRCVHTILKEYKDYRVRECPRCTITTKAGATVNFRVGRDLNAGSNDFNIFLGLMCQGRRPPGVVSRV